MALTNWQKQTLTVNVNANGWYSGVPWRPFGSLQTRFSSCVETHRKSSEIIGNIWFFLVFLTFFGELLSNYGLKLVN